MNECFVLGTWLGYCLPYANESESESFGKLGNEDAKVRLLKRSKRTRDGWMDDDDESIGHCELRVASSLAFCTSPRA